MAQSGYTPILIYASGTATNVPLAANMTSSASGAELALNYADGKLYFKNSSGAVTLLASSAATGGTFAAPVVIEGTTTDAALRITQLGSGNALLVEDSTNPDSTPFAITATGAVLVGMTTAKTTGVGSAVVQIFGGTAPLSFYREADSTTPINLEFAKARAAGAILASGDTIGRLYFSGSDGTAQIPAAYIDAVVDGTPGVNDMPGRLVFSTTADGASSPTERMRIDSAGQVGIGSASLATARLYVTLTGVDTANSESAAYSILTANNASGTAIKIGNRSSVLTGASFAGTGILNAYRADITYSLASAYSNSLQGFRTSISNSGAGAVSGVVGFSSTNPANTGGGSITNFYGFSQDDVTTATNVYGFLGTVASGTNKFNLYMSGTANNYLAGRLGIGSTGLTDALVPCAINPTGATNMHGFRQFGTIQSDVTASYSVYQSSVSTQAAAFTLTTLRHFQAVQSTIGAGSAVTTQHGFIAESSLIGATNNYGFFGNIPSGTGRYNFYASGTAQNYMAGNLSIGTTTSTSMLLVNGSSSVSAFKTPNIAEVNTISATAATGTINYDITTQSVLYFTTNASGNFTVNFRGSSGTSLNTVMSTGESISATFLVTNGATAYYNSVVQVDGSTVTPKWQGGTAPTSGNASSIDSYTYVIIKTGSAAFTVLASVTKFA